MIRVYVINMMQYDAWYDDEATTHPLDMSDSEFMDIAEEQGNVYTLEGFQIAFNEDEISSSNSYIRFISEN